MGLPVKLADLAPRFATGAFILNSGLSKRNVAPEHAAGLHGMASGAYPFLGKMEPQQLAHRRAVVDHQYFSTRHAAP